MESFNSKVGNSMPSHAYNLVGHIFEAIEDNYTNPPTLNNNEVESKKCVKKSVTSLSDAINFDRIVVGIVFIGDRKGNTNLFQ